VELLVDVEDELDDVDEELDVLDDELVDDEELVDDDELVDDEELVDDDELVLDDELLELVELLVLLELEDELDVLDDVLLDVVLEVVVVVGGTLRPMMLTRSQLHFDPVPGSVVSSFTHTLPALLSQLVQVPASTMLSALESEHVTWVVNWNVLKRQVPPPSVQGAVTAFPQGFVFWAYTSPQLSESALK
jgi:hypothetical protein